MYSFHEIKYIRIDDLTAGVGIQHPLKAAAGHKEGDDPHNDHDDGQDHKDVWDTEGSLFLFHSCLRGRRPRTPFGFIVF